MPKYSLRSLLFAIMIISVGFGMLSAAVLPSLKRSAARAELCRSGATVKAMLHKSTVLPLGEQSVVYSIEFHSCPTVQQLDVLGHFIDLRELIVDGRNRCSNECALHDKEDMCFPFCSKVSKCNESANRVRFVRAGATMTIGDYCVQQSMHCKSIETLCLPYCGVTVQGVSVIAANMTMLEYLDLTEADISDESVRGLTRLTKLEFLRLANTKITGESLMYLRQLPRLRTLAIDNVGIGNDELGELALLTSIEWIGMHGTNVDAEGIAHLRQALPNAVVAWTPSE